jgi:hypothetical protein
MRAFFLVIAVGFLAHSAYATPCEVGTEFHDRIQRKSPEPNCGAKFRKGEACVVLLSICKFYIVSDFGWRPEVYRCVLDYPIAQAAGKNETNRDELESICEASLHRWQSLGLGPEYLCHD